MNKSKMVGFLFVLLGVLVIVGSAYVIISYASGMFGAIVDFVTTNDFTKLQQCGVSPPAQFNKLKNDLTTVVLPSLYIGLPLLLIILSFLMFLGGFYYHKGRHEEELRKVEEMEREMVHRVVKKMQRGPKTSAHSSMSEDEEEPEDEPEAEPEEEPEEELPRRTRTKKK
jgi:uncharacterized protein YneF (UPF0154 family)